ncbi:MAG TPA: metal ABC transporter substrate-binding protein [Gemmatimonadota bacterium]|jgi:ABC-type Zn uptake system ZnuABC Zn-binding protein ZnuA|nr:metal ABC transporter substrate-binding protein [Gemmatimonadota bacterium]
MLRIQKIAIAALALAAVLWGPAGPTPARAQEKIRVVATLPVLAELVKVVGGDRVEVTAIATPLQDPHFVDAKPSYILAAGQARLFVTAGMDLEVGWEPLVREGSRNAAIQIGGPGYVDASAHVQKLGVPTGRLDRSRGDVHPFGNPHYWLDPLNAVPLTADIALALTRVDPANAGLYNDRRRNFLAALEGRMATWRSRMAPLRGQPVASYHESWEYFARRFGMEIVGTLEPKPGIPPSPSHLAQLMDRMKARDVKLILKEPYYENKNPDLVARETGARVVELPNQPQAGQDYLGFIDSLVDRVVAAAAGAGVAP